MLYNIKQSKKCITINTFDCYALMIHLANTGYIRLIQPFDRILKTFTFSAGSFNGAFNMLNTAGALIGEVSGGALSQTVGSRLVILLYMLACAGAAVIFIGLHRNAVSKIYNR